MLGEKGYLYTYKLTPVSQANGRPPFARCLPRLCTVSIYDEICGITLMLHLDALFDPYELGLRLVAPVRSPSFLIFYSLIINSSIN
jgi:hypothetical protein